MLGNLEPEASVPGEIVPGEEFYSYEDKYVTDGAQLLIPAPLGEAATAEVRALALRAFRALRCEGLARVDFFYEMDEHGRGRGFLLNEVNTMPGFTPISMYPEAVDPLRRAVLRTDRPPRRPRRRTPGPPPSQHHPLNGQIVVCVGISDGRAPEILTQTRIDVLTRDHPGGWGGGAMILSMSPAQPDQGSERVRSPADFLRLIVAAVAAVIVFLVAWLFGDTVVVFASDFLAGIDAVPDWLLTAMIAGARLLTVVVLVGGLLWTAVRARWAAPVAMALGGVIAAVLVAAARRARRGRRGSGRRNARLRPRAAHRRNGSRRRSASECSPPR